MEQAHANRPLGREHALLEAKQIGPGRRLNLGCPAVRARARHRARLKQTRDRSKIRDRQAGVSPGPTATHTHA